VLLIRGQESRSEIPNKFGRLIGSALQGVLPRTASHGHRVGHGNILVIQGRPAPVASVARLPHSLEKKK